MGFHQHGAHGRVFRGLKKNSHNLDSFNKRDDNDNENAQRPSHNTNGDRPIMRVPDGFPARKQADDSQSSPNLAQKAKADNDDGVETVYTAVYKTLDQTFDGPPQFFSTQGFKMPSTTIQMGAAHTTAAAADDNNSRKANNDNEDDQTPSRKPAAQTTPTSSPTAEATSNHRAATSSEESHASVTPSPSSSSVEVTSSSIETGDAPSTRNAQLADSTSSMIGATPLGAVETGSGSASPQREQTGMSGGAKAGLAMGIIFGLALVFGLVFFCWRRKKAQRGLEEHNEKSGFVAAPAPAPVNRFSAESDRQSIRSSTRTSATAPRLSLRPVTQFLPNLTGDNRKSFGNMFGTANDSNQAQTQQAPAQNPFGDAAVLSEKQVNEGANNGHDRANSVNSEGSVPPTPGSAQVATAAAVPVAARGPNNVHRVQLDFKPSMEDELELKSGQLVRMLHEYDDGWVSRSHSSVPFDLLLTTPQALCTRMDRSQKGVVPRTCLSKVPVKPRGPPPQNRPPPNGMTAPPPGPPAGPGMAPRPLTPNQQQQQQGRQRAPTLDGVPARKPVPGQAM